MKKSITALALALVACQGSVGEHADPDDALDDDIVIQTSWYSGTTGQYTRVDLMPGSGVELCGTASSVISYDATKADEDTVTVHAECRRPTAGDTITYDLRIEGYTLVGTAVSTTDGVDETFGLRSL